jgi:hypothetical protein
MFRKAAGPVGRPGFCADNDIGGWPVGSAKTYASGRTVRAPMSRVSARLSRLAWRDAAACRSVRSPGGAPARVIGAACDTHEMGWCRCWCRASCIAATRPFQAQSSFLRSRMTGCIVRVHGRNLSKTPAGKTQWRIERQRASCGAEDIWRFGTSGFSLTDQTTLLPPAEALPRWHAEMHV